MSVLSFPRIYFQGMMEWDPCTFNNNDFSQDPTYAAVEAALNWSFLEGQGVGPTAGPQDFVNTFRPWAITFQGGSAGPSAPPTEWNMFGTHSVTFAQHKNARSLITGGATGPAYPVTQDALIGGKVVLAGNGPPAVLVDTNPISFWSSQVYWGQLTLGDGASMITAPMSSRMHARWVSPFRIANAPPSAMAATGFSCCMQTGIPNDLITWPAQGVSKLADDLKAAASQAQGIMVRFTAYVNLYFQNGILNDIPITPRNYTALSQALSNAWDEWNTNGKTDLFFSNPCYSHVVGVVGVWDENELASAPGGRYLVPQTAIQGLADQATSGALGPTAIAASVRGHALIAAAGAPAAAAPPMSPLGPIVANVDEGLGIISLDMSNTIPELWSNAHPPSELVKTNFGPLSLGLLANGGSVTSIATIDYDQYKREPYTASAGILDLPFSGPADGTLVLMVGSATALLEQTYNAQTDTRGIYLDQGGATGFNVTVFENGVPSPGANLLIARYGPGSQIPANYSNLNLIPIGPTEPTGAIGPTVQVVNFTTGKQSTIHVGGTATGATANVTLITADENGIANVGIAAQAPGFMVLGFFPFAPTGATPELPTTLLGPTVSDFVSFADYTTIRVLTFDEALPQQFCDFWNNGPQDPAAAWDFIYFPPPRGQGGILYVYDMVFSVMLEHVNLGSQTGSPSSFDNNLSAIWSVIQPNSASEGSNVMPITRDLSAGKRLTLQLYIYLAAHDFKLKTPLEVDSIPPGWSPK